jgi:hypothetical protein
MAYNPPSWITQYNGPVNDPSPYSYGNEPPVGWRPFSNASAWNTPIANNPVTASDSAAIVAWLQGLGGPANRYMGVGGTAEDYDHPWYYVANGDPLKRIKLLAGSRDPSVTYSGVVTGTRLRASDLQNRTIPMPAVATAAGGTDGHLAILTNTHSYEMWQSGSWAPGEGRYGCAYGAVFDLAGTGTSTDGHAATAAGVSLLAGQIRLSELQAGHIPHALAMITKYVRRNVFADPAVGAATPDPTTTAGDVNDLQRPVTGCRMQLNYTQSEIDALAAPAWKKTILHAMREYGMIIMDTGGASWNIQLVEQLRHTYCHYRVVLTGRVYAFLRNSESCPIVYARALPKISFR